MNKLRYETISGANGFGRIYTVPSENESEVDVLTVYNPTVNGVCEIIARILSAYNASCKIPLTEREQIVAKIIEHESDELSHKYEAEQLRNKLLRIDSMPKVEEK